MMIFRYFTSYFQGVDEPSSSLRVQVAEADEAEGGLPRVHPVRDGAALAHRNQEGQDRV